MLKASDIMKRKGIVQKQMDMNKFNEVIENFFMEHEPKDTILLTPKRFIEMDNPPEGDFIDYQCMKKNRMLRPILMVNEPFIGNAAGWLRDFCGFTVKSRTRKKKKEYIVSLPV